MTQFLTCNSYIPPYMAYPKFLLKLNISETAKLVYMLLLDRARLSMKNGDWQDEMGRVFVLYTIPNLAKDIGKGETTVKKALNQLVRHDLIYKEDIEEINTKLEQVYKMLIRVMRGLGNIH